MNFQLLSSVIDELSQLVTGARVDRVYEGPGTALCLALVRDRKHFTLLLSPDRSMPRLHLVTKKPAAAPSPHVFSLYLRNRTKGARITLVSLLNQDRVAEVRFSREGSECRLLFELTGSASNIIMTDASLKILAVFYPAPAGSHGKRLLMPGIQYEPPHKRPSPSFPPVRLDAVRRDQTPGRERGRPGSANREAEDLFERLTKERNFDSIRAGLRSLVKKTLAKTGRRMGALYADRESARQAEGFKQAGELILANLRRLEPGAEQAVLAGFGGETARVRLDPRRSPADNAQLYFKKYKKAKAGRDIIAARLQQTREEDARLRSFLSELERAEDIAACVRIRSDMVANGYLRERAKEKNKKQSGPAPAPLRKIEHQGWIILVGRSAAGNDYLTTKLARPNDLWLHAEGIPGSHVLVKNPEAAAIPPAVFSKAASLAAFYSKGKAAGKVAVTYTFARHVQKPKGAKPGLVRLAERKTIMAVPEAE